MPFVTAWNHPPERWDEVKSRVRHRWALPIYRVEWLFDWVAFYLSNWALLEVLDYAGRLTVLIAVIFYFMEGPDRRKQKHYQAWQVINTAQGQTGGGGRVEALEELNDDHVPLVALNVQGAYLQGVRLPRADAHRSQMQGADLRDADFSRCDLSDSHFESANLRNTNLRGADLRNTHLAAADLTGADLSDTNLAGADLSHATVEGIRWQSIHDIRGANLHGVENAPPGFVNWAKARGAVDVVPATEPDEEV